nr:hypothetical protein [Xylella fastidiosa]
MIALASSETRQTLSQLQQQMSALQAALDSAHSGPQRHSFKPSTRSTW